jgi:hypothetical protein
MAKRNENQPEPRLGFTVWIQPRPGIHPSAESAFARRLDDYLSERRLSMAGAPLCLVLWSEERSLGAVDQVDFIEWLISDPISPTVVLSPLSERIDVVADRGAGWLRADVTDMTLIPLTWLYSIHRISAEQYLQILGGFVRPAVKH